MPRRKRGLAPASGQGAPPPDETAAALVLRITSGRTDGSEHATQIAIDDLLTAPWQPRRDSGAEEIEALADSIERDGLLQPLLVRPHPDERGRFQVIFGHRRLEAVRLVAARQGIAEGEYRIDAKIRECSDLEARILTSVENLRRKDLSSYELALDVVGVQDALRGAGLPHTDRDLAPYFELSAGTIAEYRVIGTEIDETMLRAAGFTTKETDGDTDWARVGELTKAELHDAARAQTTTERLNRLRRAARSAHSREAASRASRGRAAEAIRKAGPRFTVDGLRSRGRFAMKLTRPFTSYSEDESRRYLADLLPAVVALTRNLSGDGIGDLIQCGRDREGYLHAAIQELDRMLRTATARMHAEIATPSGDDTGG